MQYNTIKYHIVGVHLLTGANEMVIMVDWNSKHWK